MIFPFSKKYSIRLRYNFSEERNRMALEFVRGFIKKRGAENVEIENNKLTFKSGFIGIARWDTSMLVLLDEGSFLIEESGSITTLTYQLKMYYHFLIIAIMSTFLGIGSESILFGIVCFLWIGGIPWLIALDSHKKMVSEIANGINILINKTVEPEVK